MTDLLKHHDIWLTDQGPAALVIREHLMPAEGRDGVLFPATFAPGEDKSKFPGGYNIDRASPGSANGGSICLIDSVGSQANRVEPEFGKPKYESLIPQVAVKAGERAISLLEAGHRAGDALVRCTPLKDEVKQAFQAIVTGDAAPLAKIAPTSLVFGAWDSRVTQVKVPRLVSSTIRAYGVGELTRSAQYIPPVQYANEGLLEEPGDLRDTDGRIKGKHPFAKRGFVEVPATNAPGGIIAHGGIRRDATLNLAALRLLKSGSSAEQTLSLRRYILGLALVAFTHPSAFVGYLRQGCTLVLDPEGKPSPREMVAAHHDGRREPLSLSHDDALSYALATAKAFGVGQNREVEFDKALAKAEVAGDGEGGTGKRKKGKAVATPSS